MINITVYTQQQQEQHLNNVLHAEDDKESGKWLKCN